MRIITVNLPKEIIDEIDKYVGDHKTYPSRSELIRVAVRDFLIEILDSAENKPPAATILNDSKNFVTVKNENGEETICFNDIGKNGERVLKTFTIKKK